MSFTPIGTVFKNTQKKVHYANAGEIIDEFENASLDLLSCIKISGWNAWRIVKTDLFFKCIYSNDNHAVSSTKRRKLTTARLKKIINLIKTFAKLFSIAYQKRKSVDLVLISTMSANKTYIDANGNSVDILVDHFIKSGIIRNYIYIETPDNHERHLQPSLVKAQFYTTQFSIIIHFISKLLQLFNVHKKEAYELSNIWNNTFKKLDLAVDRQQLQTYFIYFSAEYYFYLVIYKILQPSIAIFNDQMATGRMAAAKKLKIKTIELQHGLMSKYYPQYLLHPNFKKIKNELPIADLIGVFGEFHKKQLTKKGFYTEKDVFVIGKFGMNHALEPIDRFSQFKTILFITQGELLFNQTMGDIEAILNNLDYNEYYLVIKVHPLEPLRLLEFYAQLHRRYPNQIKIIQKEYSIGQILPIVDYVVGYYSTVLLEALFFNKPVFSLCHEYCSQGIFSIIGNDQELRKSITICEDITDFINSLIEKESILYENRNISNYLFDHNYEMNCLDLIAKKIKE